MEEDLSDLSGTLLEIYRRNIVFLEKNFPKIFEDIDTLSKDFEMGKSFPKYALEYVDDYFDILNVETNSWYYGENSYLDGDFRAEHSNFTKDGSLDLLRKGLGGKKLAKGESFKDVLPIIDYMNDIIDFDAIEFQKVYKFIFIGTGLGIHLHEINKKLNPFTTLIIEPELEIFRLSLFVTDYSEFQINNKKLFLYVGEDKFERINAIQQFYNYHNYMNYNIKHHLLLQNYGPILDEIKDFFSTNTSISFPYSLTLKNIHKTIDFMKEEERFFDTTLILEKKVLKDKPTLIVAAGPSLDNYIDWIYEHQNKFIIVCVDVILRKLESHKIVPDIVVSIDPSHLCGKYLTTEDKDFLKESAIVFLSQQDKEAIEATKDIKKYFSQSIPLIESIGYMGSVSNVGTFAFLVSAHFGANKIYTIGNDAAFNQETGNRYSQGSSNDLIDMLHLGDANENVISNYDIIEVEGNLREKVSTNRVLMTFKESFESTIYGLKNFYDEIEVFNLSDGVKLNGFEPMSFEVIDALQKEMRVKEKNIHDLMNEISVIVEMPDYKKDIKILNSIINKTKKNKKNSLASRNEFLEQKLSLMVWILEQSKKTSSALIGNMFLHYTGLVDIYVNFLLNLRQENIYDKKHLTKINQLWLDGVVNVISDIKKAIS